MAARPPAVVDLQWAGGLRFAASFPSSPSSADAAPLVLDSAGAAGPSPVSALAAALAACMSIDLAHILSRGRHSFRDLRVHLEAERSPEDPHRLVHVTLHFAIAGDVAAEAVERAIALSRERYCSVWHSMRQDIDLEVTFEFIS